MSATKTASLASQDQAKNGIKRAGGKDKKDDLIDEQEIRKLAIAVCEKKGELYSLWRPLDVFYLVIALLRSEWSQWNDKYAIDDDGAAAKEQCVTQYTNVGLLGALVFTVAVELVLMMDPNQGALFSAENNIWYSYLSISSAIALACSMLISVFFSLILNELSDDDTLQWLSSMGKLETIPVTSLIIGMAILVAIVAMFTFDCMTKGQWFGMWSVIIIFLAIPFLAFPVFRGVQELHAVSKVNAQLLDRDDEEAPEKMNIPYDELYPKLKKYSEDVGGMDYADRGEFLKWLGLDGNTANPKKWELTEATIIRAKKVYREAMEEVLTKN